jgi:putative ABC transport system ATP-binding protein
MKISVRCDNLAVGWPGRTLLSGVSEMFEFGKLNYTLPIIGRTGRGKSTLLYALSGMARPLDGAVSWSLPDDVSWSSEPAGFKAINDVRRRRFGFLLQDASMIPCFTVAENLRHTLALRSITTGVEAHVESSIAKMLIEGETVGHFYNRFPAQLSGGMRQRMALAAAIVHDPQVLFADEPTASLDDATGLEVLRVVRRWLDERPGERAFVFVTHRVETLKQGAGATHLLRLSTETLNEAATDAHDEDGTKKKTRVRSDLETIQ